MTTIWRPFALKGAGVWGDKALFSPASITRVLWNGCCPTLALKTFSRNSGALLFFPEHLLPIYYGLTPTRKD